MLKEFNRIEELRKAVDEITSDDYCARVMDTVDSPVGDSLEMVIHHAERYIEVSEIVQKKVDELKQSRDYPHNFKGQMVEDFEWVLELLNWPRINVGGSICFIVINAVAEIVAKERI